MKRNTLMILGVLVSGLLIAGVFGYQRLTASAATTTTTQQTTTVSRGNLTATVSAAGNVSAITQTSLAFQTSGRVTQVNVQVGDAVKKGQVLMQLDATDLETALKSAQLSLTNAQTAYQSAKLDNAQNANQLLIAKGALDKATIALQKAQADYNTVAWRPDVGMTSQSQALQSASIDYQSAKATYDKTVAGINDLALQQAQAQVDSAQIAVEQAQRNLDKAKLIAPYDGIIAAVNYSVGDTAGASAAVTIVDPVNLQVKVTVAEVDIAKIKAGETAQMTLDALTGKQYHAKVIAVAPVATVTQGVVNYPVTLAITDNDGAIKPGMTANLSVVVEERDNVLLVPLRAVKTQGNQKLVTVIDQGQNIAVPVTVGLTNDQSAEITSNNLREGDRVLINQTTTRSTGGGGPGGPGGFGIPGLGRID